MYSLVFKISNWAMHSTVFRMSHWKMYSIVFRIRAMYRMVL